jgi:DinB superfamily
MDQLRFPLGHYQKPEFITPQIIDTYISVIENFPTLLKAEVLHLTEAQLDTPYRPEGWTIRQVVHHCADSHANSLIRFKLALTEEKPIIKPYCEDLWAELEDSKLAPITPSLQMIEGIHSRWVMLLKTLKPEQLTRTFIHPEHGKEFRIDENIGVYAFHCQHHLAHIKSLGFSKA